MSRVLCAIALAAVSGCIAPNPLRPLETPEGSASPLRETAAPRQVQLEPPPPPPAPIPKPTRRVAVLVTERINRESQSRRDPESEAIVAEMLLSAAQELEIDVVKKGAYDDILARKVAFGTAEGVIDRLNQLREQLGIDGIVTELNPGGLIPLELERRSLQLLTRDVIPAFK